MIQLQLPPSLSKSRAPCKLFLQYVITLGNAEATGMISMEGIGMSMAATGKKAGEATGILMEHTMCAFEAPVAALTVVLFWGHLR